ncbi:SGNH/GDSL hydrolase family protein [Acetobacter sp. AC2005]|uniref:SGNH/GDSL hydrolase family protein n=1 Tax=Acetobacter sp. AC2005 TaxID=3134142 RepID=UPI0030CF0CCD
MSFTKLSSLPHVARLLRHKKPVKITLFGSSSTEGVGASSIAASYAGVFEQTLRAAVPDKLEVINRGIGGQGAVQMHARLAQVLADKADLVIWQGGVNDPLTGVNLADFEQLTRDDLQALRENGADIALMDLQWCRLLDECPLAPAFQASVHALGRELEMPVFPRFDLMKQWSKTYGLRREDLSPDGIHMGDIGYRLLGEAVAKWVLELAEG